MQQDARALLESISLEHERFSLQLEARTEELQQHEEELKRREIHIQFEERKVNLLRKMNARARSERKKADENALRLVEDEERKIEELNQKIKLLEKAIDDRQRLDMEKDRMKRDVYAMTHMGESRHTDLKKRMEAIKEDLKLKEEELEGLKDMNRTLTIKERKLKDELQNARRELISGLTDSSGSIGVKRMGELDATPFNDAARKKYPKKEAPEKALELCSMWEDYLRDPSWHPFKVIMVGKESKEIIDEEDERIKGLKNEHGEEVYEAVIKALSEMNEFNTSGRYIMPKLWNRKENRKASLAEGVGYILNQWKFFKQKRR